MRGDPGFEAIVTQSVSHRIARPLAASLCEAAEDQLTG